MRTPEQKEATRLRKLSERRAHHERVFKKYSPSVRYAKAKFKKGKKRQKRSHKASFRLGVQ